MERIKMKFPECDDIFSTEGRTRQTARKRNQMVALLPRATAVWNFFRPPWRLFRSGRAFQRERFVNAGHGRMRRNFNPRYNSYGKWREFRANVWKECATRRTTSSRTSGNSLQAALERKLKNVGINCCRRIKYKLQNFD